MYPDWLEEGPKAEHLKFSIAADNFMGLQAVTALKDFGFADRTTTAEKAEDIGRVPLEDFFQKLFYPRTNNDLLSPREMTQWKNFGRALQKEGKNFFTYLQSKGLIVRGQMQLQNLDKPLIDEIKEEVKTISLTGKPSEKSIAKIKKPLPNCIPIETEEFLNNLEENSKLELVQLDNEGNIIAVNETNIQQWNSIKLLGLAKGLWKHLDLTKIQDVSQFRV
jgi:hypothetical protein